MKVRGGETDGFLSSERRDTAPGSRRRLLRERERNLSGLESVWHNLFPYWDTTDTGRHLYSTQEYVDTGIGDRTWKDKTNLRT